MTIVELAWLNGLGGYGGKCNWYHDLEAPTPAVYAAMADGMKAPWKSSRSEIRTFDLPLRGIDELLAYIGTYEGKRFVGAEVYASAETRVAHSTLPAVQRYLLNYAANAPHYSETDRNCQTFAADFYAFLSGQHRGPGTEPFHPLLRVNFRQRPWWFLYPPAEP